MRVRVGAFGVSGVADEGDLHARIDPGSFLEPVGNGEIPIGSTAITAFGVIV